MLDDDSGKLGEITELFTDVTLPIRVEKLLDVRSTQCFLEIGGGGGGQTNIFRNRGGRRLQLNAKIG